MNPPAIQARPPWLSWPIPLAAVLTVLAVVFSLICWFGLSNPNLIPELFNQSWNNTGGMIAAAGTVLILFFVPLTWMLVSRRADFMAMWLMQNALLAGGYFFLDQTAVALDIPKLIPAIMQTGVLVAVINALGFTILLVTLGLTFLFARLARAEVRPLLAPPEIYDRRLLIVLRYAALFCVGVIILNMAATRTIPMLAADPEEARYLFEDNSVTRPLFLVNMAYLPFVFGGLLVMLYRNRRHLWGGDGWLAGMLLLAQLLSGDRFPLAIAVMVAIILLSMERKWPRSLLFVAVVGYFVLFVGLSGFTSIWRQNREALSSKEGIVATSFREAYTGNNLIDYRDAAWVFSQWDHKPLIGITYLGGMTEMLPSGVFPMKKQWHLGLVALGIVGWGGVKHFGLRLTCFGESFLNFGFAGVVGMGMILGITIGALLQYQHLLSRPGQPACLSRNLSVVMLMQMLIIWTCSGDAYQFWALLALFGFIRIFVFYGGNRRKFSLEHMKPAGTSSFP